MAEEALPEIGTVISDGTIYAGISPTTQRPMYAAPIDCPTTSMRFNKAAKYAKKLTVGDKQDFRIPSKEELQVLFENREKGALKGTFNLTNEDAGYYWSSTRYGIYTVWDQAFSDGKQYGSFKNLNGSSLRCIRG